MILAQPLLLAIVLFLGWFYFVGIRSQLSDRILFGILLCSMVIIIIQPALATDVANLLGIGRGVDLLFYLFSLFVLYCLILIYRKLREIERITTQIIQAQSLMNAKKPETAVSEQSEPR
jgi:hypothetical protein